MKELLIITALTIFFLVFAVLGLALKTMFKKNSQLTTCSGSATGGECGCVTQQTCNTAVK